MTNERHNFRAEIKAALAAAPAEFEIPALAASLHIPEDEWETIVDADPEFLRDGGRVCRREAFFTGRKFLITPETWEIEAGILIPGHRFVPYLDPEVFPSETVLILEYPEKYYGSRLQINFRVVGFGGEGDISVPIEDLAAIMRSATGSYLQ